MFAVLGAIVAAAAGFFIKSKSGGSLMDIPKKIELDIDLWEKNQLLFVFIFLVAMAFLATRL